MNILLITPFLPYPVDSGGNRRTFSLIQHLERHGVRFTVLVVTGNRVPLEHIDALKTRCSKVDVVVLPLANRLSDKVIYYTLAQMRLGWLWFKDLRNEVQRISKDRDIDIIQAEYTQVGRFIPRGRKPGVIVALELRWQVLRREAGLEKTTVRRMQKLLASSLMRREELATCAQHRHVICMSKYDKDLLDSLRPRLCTTVIENGVDANLYAWRGQPPEKPGLYFLGWFINRQNGLALDFFLDYLWPHLRENRPDTIVAGGDLDTTRQIRLQGERIRYLGFLDTEQQLKILRNRALVVPLLSGGGTRLKILEAMSLGNPVISTTIGIEGIEAIPDVHFLKADTAEEFIKAIRQLLTSPALWASLSQNARDLIEENYDWKHLAMKQFTAYQEMLGSHRDTTGRETRNTL